MKKIITGISILLVSIFLIFCQNIHANDEIKTYTDITIENSTGFKSYMGHRAITKSDSKQGKLQKKCTTDKDGFRRCVDRYVIAVGTGVGGQIGDCVDLFLENGEIIPCVIGDYKADKYTDSANIVGENGCCTEFIVDSYMLRSDIKRIGDVSHGYSGWDSPVVVIRRYIYNCLGGN